MSPFADIESYTLYAESSDERQEKCSDGRFEFAVESFGDELKEFEGELLSLLKIMGVLSRYGLMVFKQSYTLRGCLEIGIA